MKVLSFNTLGSFGDPARQQDMLKFVESVNPDVAFFPEAMRQQDSKLVVDSSMVALRGLGYHVTPGYDNDVDDRTDRTGFIGIVRSELGKGTQVWAGTRQGFAAAVQSDEFDRPLKIGGVHLDDRREESRLRQLSGLSGFDVFMSDMNAMHRSAGFARALRFIAPITELLPEQNTDFSINTSKLGQMVSQGQRLVRMADGRTLKLVENEWGLRDADPRHQPTMHGLVQLDHIMVAADIEATDFTVHRAVKLSDHKPISATLRPAD